MALRRIIMLIKRRLQERREKSSVSSTCNAQEMEDMERSLCLFPTEANAKRAGMSLEDYEQFVFKGCGLLEETLRMFGSRYEKNNKPL